MRIICTVEELVSMARGCENFRRSNSCAKCVMSEICRAKDGFIEAFVSASDVIEKEDDHAQTD